MEEDARQRLELTRTSIDMTRRSGLLREIFSLLHSGRLQETPEEQPEYRERTVDALRENAAETLYGLELTIQEALQFLGSDFALELLDDASSTWQMHWTGGASRVGIDDEERRTWWARLLAEEIKQPGTYSLRTLAALDTLSTQDARLFTRLCGYVWMSDEPVLILPSEGSDLWRPHFNTAILLEDAGLVKFDTGTGFTWSIDRRYRVRGVMPQAPGALPMTFCNEAYAVFDPNGGLVTLECGQLLLTEIGKEMYSLITPSYSEDYLEEIVAEWQQSYTVTLDVE